MTPSTALPVRLLSWAAAATIVVAIAASAPARALAQTPASMHLTLADALKLAADHSETLAIARAGEARADADQVRANSQRLPQVNLVGSYDRTLASEFSAVLDNTGPVCAPLSVDASRPLADRVTELERAASCGSIGPSFNFANLPFGQRNVYRLTFSFAQSLYTGGRLTAQRTQAEMERRNAELATTGTGAQLQLDVARAYFDAALSDRLLAIAQLGLTQASAVYDQTRQSFEAGRQPEFELLRAQVARDNQRPNVIRAQAARDIAYLRLRQLLEVPAGTDLQLDADFDAATLAPPPEFAEGLAAARAHATEITPTRTSVQQAETLVHLREAAITAARAERLPNVSLNSSYGKVGYPGEGFLPGVGDFRTNWTAGAAVTVPVFNGNRLRADEAAARADLAEAQARLKQTREVADLDAATAFQTLTSAEATWEATGGVVQQAQRAYDIAELRYREGISTQLELSDSRLALQQAQANRAQAARDVQIARVRVALLAQLPLAGGGL